MIYILLLMLFIIGCLIIKLYEVNKLKRIYYSNYKNCLKVLTQYDKELAYYLDKESEKNK